MTHKKMLIPLFFLAATLQLSAQKKPATPQTKAPVLHTQISTFSDSAIVTVAEAEHIIDLPLRIFDDKRVAYPVSSYQFLYRKKGVTENEQTGKITPIYSIASNLFKTTPLPTIWITSIREQLKPGEEFFFFDVVAKDAQGRVMYAPNLRILVR